MVRATGRCNPELRVHVPIPLGSQHPKNIYIPNNGLAARRDHWGQVMRLGILGPLLIADDEGREISIAAARQRTFLAALLIRGNQILPKEELVDIVWDDAPPNGAVRTLRSYVTRLRHSAGPELAARIISRGPGYLCKVADEELDLLCFEALCQDADVAWRQGDWAGASAKATQATTLWRGTPLLDVPSQKLRDEVVPRLEQTRLQVLERRIEADLRLHQHERLA